MESLQTTISSPPVNIAVLQIQRITRGLFGQFTWRPSGQKVLLGAPEGDCQSWTVATGQVLGKGTTAQAHVASEGWSVFALSATNNIADLICEKLEKHLPDGFHESGGQLGGDLESHLFWDLIPKTAFVAHHNRTNEIWLVRDVLGFVPIYYRAVSEGVTLSTSLPWLRDVVDESGINVGKLAELITFGHHFGSSTVWRGIDVVAPGQCVVLSPDKLVRRLWFAKPEIAFDAAERSRLSSLSTEQLSAESRKLVEDSVSRAIQGKSFVVQGGGGVDSSVLTALATHLRSDVVSWSINHPDLSPSEASWVRPLAARLQVQARFADVTRPLFIESLVDVMTRAGQPLIGPNFIGGAILRQQALMTSTDELHFLNGELCDTIFGGLSSFHQLALRRRSARKLSRLPARMRRMIKRGLLDDRDWLAFRVLGLPERDFASCAFGSLERAELIDEIHSVGRQHSDSVQALANQLTWFDFRRVPCALHHGFYERDEWYGGDFLFPFADASLLRFGFNLPCKYKYRSGHTKWLWRNLAADLIGKDVAFRPKKGFDAPIRDWLRPVLKMFDGGFAADVFRLSSGQFATRLAEREALLWPLANIELWGRLHCCGESPSDVFEKLMS